MARGNGHGEVSGVQPVLCAVHGEQLQDLEQRQRAVEGTCAGVVADMRALRWQLGLIALLGSVLGTPVADLIMAVVTP